MPEDRQRPSQHLLNRQAGMRPDCDAEIPQHAWGPPTGSWVIYEPAAFETSLTWT